MDPRNPQMPASPEPAPQPQSGEPLKPAVPELPQSQPTATPAPTPPPADPALPIPPPPVSAPAAQPIASSPASPTPSMADDVDVIEKEWVDAADQVVKTNKEDPHREEEAFEALQVDYLKKRYGKDIKQPTDE